MNKIALRNEYYFLKARNESLKSNYHDIHIGCVAVYKNQIIASGHNSSKTHPIQSLYNKYRPISGVGYLPAKLHAEIDCLNKLRSLDIDFSKVSLYVFRETKTGKFGMCRPCRACMNAINDLGIKNIYYTTELGFTHEFIAADRKIS